MKNKGKFLFSILLLAIMVFANSCSFEMNKRRYNRGWDFGYSSKYGSVESPKKKKPLTIADSIELQTNIEQETQTMQIESPIEYDYFSNDIEQVYFQNDTLDSLNQPDTTVVEVIVAEDEINSTSGDEVKNVVETETETETETKEKDKIYTLAIVFMTILTLFSFFYIPFLFISTINLFFLSSANLRLLLILSSLFIGGKIISLFMLFRAGANLKKEKTYSGYKSKYDSLVSLSFFSMGLLITFLFAAIFKRKKAEFPEEVSTTKKSKISKGLRLIVGLIIAMFLMTFMIGFFF